MKLLTKIGLIFSLLTIGNTSQARELFYEFNIEYISGSPDGVYKSKILTVNGLFPGPTIEGQVGDILNVLVHNNIQDGQNTSIHWHGLHQQSSQFEDGASHITQCPLKVGRSQTYRFPLDQAGTHWYHAHEGVQYTEGLWGAIIIHPFPETHTYDHEILIMLSDWYHRSGKENAAWHLSTLARGIPPYPESILMNGRGRYPCEFATARNFPCDPTLQKRHIFHVVPNKIYRFRVINTSAKPSYTFSIDGHILSTIEVDGVDVKTPVEAQTAVIGAAQRYSFLVNTSVGVEHERFLIRSKVFEMILILENENINPYPHALIDEVTGVLMYDSHEPNRFGSQEHYSTEPHNYSMQVPPSEELDPVLLDEALLQPLDGIQAPSYYDVEYILFAVFGSFEGDGVRRGSFNGTSFKLPEGKPLLARFVSGEPIPEQTRPLYIRKGDVVQVVVNNEFFGHHTFHLHGHTFWVLGKGAKGDGNYDAGRHALRLDGARRDTVLFEEQSWGVIRFIADNPGVWLFHCHNEWHTLSGMVVSFIEGIETVRNPDKSRNTNNNDTISLPEEAVRVCNDHGIDL